MIGEVGPSDQGRREDARADRLPLRQPRRPLRRGTATTSPTPTRFELVIRTRVGPVHAGAPARESTSGAAWWPWRRRRPALLPRGLGPRWRSSPARRSSSSDAAMDSSWGSKTARKPPFCLSFEARRKKRRPGEISWLTAPRAVLVIALLRGGFLREPGRAKLTCEGCLTRT